MQGAVRRVFCHSIICRVTHIIGDIAVVKHRVDLRTLDGTGRREGEEEREETRQIFPRAETISSMHM